MASPFDKVRGFKPGRSFFPLNHSHQLTGDMGLLYPVLLTEANPADIFSKIGANLVIRFMPMVAPILHTITAFIHYFFVPYRLLDDDWEDFITSGEDGTDASTLPTWNPSDTTVGSLWDYMPGFPKGVTPDADNRPLAFPLLAYNLIYNTYYRDEWLVTEYALTDEDVKRRAWEKDYFTSALSNQQKGTAPALPVSGTLNIDASAMVSGSGSYVQARSVMTDTGGTDNLQTPSGTYNSQLQNALEAMTVDLSGATTFDVPDIRLAIQIQRWLERNARTGSRYNEHLRAHHGVSPRDERLNRPEYIGGLRTPIIVSEVLQTSSEGSTEAVGTMAGHGITSGAQIAGRYHVTEYGLIMGILSVMPKASYSQGLNRMWSRQTRYEFFNPEFAFLSEQAILRKEIFMNGTKADNETIFGYQGQYDELRYIPSTYSGELNFGEAYDHWNIGRYFSTFPSLNQTFIECTPRKDFLAASSEPTFIAHIGNILEAYRALPVLGTPGINRI